MENTLVTELRSITAAALTAMSAAERANWEEAEKCVCDLGDRVNRVQRQIWIPTTNPRPGREQVAVLGLTTSRGNPCFLPFKAPPLVVVSGEQEIGHAPSASWELYFTTYWWVFAALATIGIVSTGILYFEHVAGRHIVDWCSAICAMLGALIGALLIVLTHSQLGTRNDGNATAQHLGQVEARLRILESQDAGGKSKTEGAMFFPDFTLTPVTKP